MLLAILINMGLVKKPRYEDHWSTNLFLSSNGIPRFMYRDRFEIILTHLHFYDNNAETPTEPQQVESQQAEQAVPLLAVSQDKIKKIRPLVDLLNKKCSNVYTPDKDLAIDESLVKFKGRLGFKQYIPAKRARFGIKLFVLCESSGFVWNMHVYQGKSTIVGK